MQKLGGGGRWTRLLRRKEKQLSYVKAMGGKRGTLTGLMEDCITPQLWIKDLKPYR